MSPAAAPAASGTTRDAAPPPRRRRFLPSILLGCLGAAVVLWANDSPRLPGLTSDSLQYLGAARSLARLEGPVIPVAPWSSPTPTSTLAHYPPGFSAVLAPLVALGLDASVAATLVMALSAGVTLALLFALGATLAGVPGGLFSAALVAFYPEWVRLHTAVWSEPLYLALFLAAVLALARRPERSGLHGALAAACAAVRYVGVSVTLLALVVAWRRGPEGRARRLALAGLPSLVLLAAWSLYVRAHGSEVRHFGFNRGIVPWLARVAPVLAVWAAPIGGQALGGALLVLVAALVARSPLWRTPEGRAFRSAALWATLFYLVTLTASRALADPGIPMDARMILPLLALGAVAVGGSLAVGLSRGRGIAGALAVVAVTGWAVGGARTVQQGVASFKDTGEYFTHVFWPQSAPVRWALAAAGEGMTLYSNEPELLYLYSGRSARHAAVFGDDLDSWRRAWRAHPGPLVMLNPPKPGDLPPGALLDGLDVKMITASAEGAVFWR